MSHKHVLRRLTEIEVYLLDETEFCKKLPKRIKQFNTITSMIDKDLMKLKFIIGGVSIDAFEISVVLHAGIALCETNLIFSLGEYFRINTVKQENHDATKLLGQGK